MEKEPRGRVFRERLAKLLAGPRGGGMARHVEVEDPTPIVGKHHEHEQDMQVSVGTMKKSTATVDPRWFERKVRQL